MGCGQSKVGEPKECSNLMDELTEKAKNLKRLQDRKSNHSII